MKKFLALLLTLILGAGLLSGCVSSRPTEESDESAGTSGESGASGGVVNVYNWGEYIDESVLTDFEEATGIHVNYQMYDSNETMYGKIAGGGADYDVVIPSDYMISRMIAEDMLEPLNFDNIPNFADIDPALLNPAYDPENLYSVPYMWGLLGVIYNTTLVDEADTGSWDLMWNEKYADDIVIFDNSRDTIGIALKRLGYSYNTTDEAQIKEAVDLLIQQKPLIQAYVMDDIFGKMEGGNAAIGTYYYGDFLTMLENNPDLAFYIPEEGTNIYVDAMCILKGAKNKENAEAFINYMCSTEAGLKNCEAIWYSTPLLSVREELDPERYPAMCTPTLTRASWLSARAMRGCPRPRWTCMTVSGPGSSPRPDTKGGYIHDRYRHKMPAGGDGYGSADRPGRRLRLPAGVRHALYGGPDGERRTDLPPDLSWRRPGQRGHPSGYHSRRPYPCGHDRLGGGGDPLRLRKREDGGLSGQGLGRIRSHRPGRSHPGHHPKPAVSDQVQRQAPVQVKKPEDGQWPSSGFFQNKVI